MIFPWKFFSSSNGNLASILQELTFVFVESDFLGIKKYIYIHYFKYFVKNMSILKIWNIKQFVFTLKRKNMWSLLRYPDELRTFRFYFPWGEGLTVGMLARYWGGDSKGTCVHLLEVFAGESGRKKDLTHSEGKVLWWHMVISHFLSSFCAPFLLL